MKWAIASAFLLCGTASFAQVAGPGPYALVGHLPSFGSNQGVAPLDQGFGLPDTSITPTMQRQRAAKARLVEAMFPQLRAEMAHLSYARARDLYAKAEKQAFAASRDFH